MMIAIETSTRHPPSVQQAGGLCVAPGPALVHGPTCGGPSCIWARYARDRLAGKVHPPSVSSRSWRDVRRQVEAAKLERWI